MMQRRPPAWPLGSLCHLPAQARSGGAVASDGAFAASKSRSNVEQHPARSRTGRTADPFTRASYQVGRIFHPIPRVPPTEGCRVERKEMPMRLAMIAILALILVSGAAPAGEEAPLAIQLPLGRVAYQTNESIELAVVRSG